MTQNADSVAICEGEHRWSPLMMGVGGKEYLRCQDCPTNKEITPEVYRKWEAHYLDCVARNVEYHGVMGDFWSRSGTES